MLLKNLNLYLLILTFIINGTLYSQEIKGKITDQSSKVLPFVNVYLTKVSDTTKILQGTTTDFQGNFILKTAQTKTPLYLFASFLGYKQQKIKLDSIPKKAFIITLKVSVNQLDEVIIEADKPVKQYVNKTVYSIDKSLVKKSTTGTELLKIVPELMIDENNNLIQTIQRKNVLVLINGIHSTPIELKTLSPKEIAKIEYYDMPTARYQNMGVASVINIITKKNIRGGNIMLDTRQSIDPFTISDYLISGKYNYKNSQFNLFYNYSNRDYKKKKYLSENTLIIDNVLNKETSESFYFPFGYDMHTVKTSYNLVKNENYLFHISFDAVYSKSYNNEKYTFERENGASQISGIGNSDYYDDDFSPKLDIYFQKTLKNNRQLIFDIVGQINQITSDYEKQEIDNSNTIILHDFSYDDNKKKSIISEVVYDFSYKKIRFETGAYYKYGTLQQNTNNYLTQGKFELNKQEIRTYISAIGRYKNLNYSFGINDEYSTFNNDENSSGYESNKITGNINFSYPVSKHSQLSLKYEKSAHTPKLSYLNEQQYFIKPNFIRQGNPNLQPYNTHSISLTFNYYKPNFISMLKTGYGYSANPIFNIYHIKDSQLISTYINGAYSNTKYFAVFLKKFFFKKALSLSLYSSLFDFNNEFNKQEQKNLSGIYYNFNMQYYYKGFIINLKMENPYETLDDYTIQKHNVNSDINIRYKYNAWTFGIGVYMPFEKSYMNEYSLQSPLYNDDTRVEIFDSSNYFYLTLNYNFSFGKQLRANKKISNSDDDTGTIKH